MPLDGEEHARAEHKDLERDEDYRNPIHILITSKLLIQLIRSVERQLKNYFSSFIFNHSTN